MNKISYLSYLIIFIFSQSCIVKNTTEIKKKDIKLVSTEETNQKLIPFDYRILMKETLKYFRYEKKNVIETSLRRDSIEYKSYFYKLDEINEIALCVHSPQEAVFESGTPYLYHARDYLLIGDKKFIFDELIYGEKYKYLKEPPKSMILMNSYKFDFNEKKCFVAFFVTALSSSNPDFYIILFDISQKTIPLLLLSEYQASEDIHCLGDFNQDNQLDYAQYHFGDKLEYQTLGANNQFEKKEDYYLTIVSGSYKPKIDLEKSKWFFDLGKK